MTTYTNPATGQQEQITDARALRTVEQRTAAAKAAQAAFESQCRCGVCTACGHCPECLDGTLGLNGTYCRNCHRTQRS